MTTEDARRIAEQWLAGQSWGDQFQVAEIQMAEGLALAFWTAKSGELIAGNAPLLIDARTGAVHSTGTARPMPYYMENFRITGDPHIQPLEVAKIRRWQPGAQKVSAVTVLKENTQLGLAGSKAIIDAVLRGEEATVYPRDGVSADELSAKLTQLGFDAEKEFCARSPDSPTSPPIQPR